MLFLPKCHQQTLLSPIVVVHIDYLWLESVSCTLVANKSLMITQILHQIKANYKKEEEEKRCWTSIGYFWHQSGQREVMHFGL